MCSSCIRLTWYEPRGARLLCSPLAFAQNSYPDGAYMLAEKQKKDKALNAFLREQQLKTMNKLDLASLLIMPIQRVPRYRMLLEVLDSALLVARY